MENYFQESERKPLVLDGIEFFLQEVNLPNLETPVARAHIHSAVEILFIDSGEFLIYANDTAFHVKPGDVILFRSKTIHRIYAKQVDNCGYYVLKINPSVISDFSFHEHGYRYMIRFALNGKDNKTVWDQQEALDYGITAAFRCLIQEYQQQAYGYDMSMKIHAASILLSILRSITQGPQSNNTVDNENTVRRIYNAMLYINTHYGDNITAEECSSQAFMSYSYFSRCFRRISGKSFKEYLNAVRINHAEKALLSGENSITEIASACGFNSVSYFIATYKKMKGITPLEFRKTNQI